MATEYDFDLYQGESLDATLRVRSDEGEPIDFTDYSISGYISSSYCCSGIYSPLNVTVLAPPESGYLRLFVSGEQTIGFPVTKLPYYVRRYNVSGINEIFLFGDFNIDPS